MFCASQVVYPRKAVALCPANAYVFFAVNTDNDNNRASEPAGSGGEPSSSISASAPGDTPGVPDAAASGVDPIVTERDHIKEQLLRTAADFDNYRKRARREIEDARMRGKDEAIKEILPVFDNLERAVAAADSAQSVASVVEGVKMVLKLFQDTAERLGLNRVPTVGERFDPQMHEAIQQKETDEAAPGTILTEVVPGYMFGQRLLRAAMVVVARKPQKPAADGDTTAADGGGNGASSSNAPSPESVRPTTRPGPGTSGTPE